MSIEEYSNGIIKGVSRKNVVIKKGLRTFLNDKRNLMLLFGTSGSWFLLDYAYYGNTISTPLVLKSVAPHSQLLQQLSWSLLIFVIAAAPGYVLACMKIDQIGHRRLQWIGFIMMGLCFGAIGILPGVSHEILPFLFLYGASYFFTEFGPNVTTFVIPTEVFSINGRATGHGIAAGIGKLGAFIGVFLFPILTTSFGLSGTLLISSGCAFAGAILSFILPEPAGKSLEEVSEEHRFIITNKNLSLAKAPIKSTR